MEDKKRINKLWETYIQIKNGKNNEEIIKIRNKILLYYYPIVQRIAKNQSYKIGGRFSQQELESYGVEGLIKAIEKYDLDKNIKFITFATYRISGSILDFLRSNDFVPRSVRDRSKKIDKKMTQNLNNNEGKTEREIFKEIGFSYKDSLINDRKYSPKDMISIEQISQEEDDNIIEYLEDSATEKPESFLMKNEFFSKIAGNGLSQQERNIVYLHYYRGFSFEKISKKMNICISSVVNKHKTALYRMRGKVERNPEYFKEELILYKGEE